MSLGTAIITVNAPLHKNAFQQDAYRPLFTVWEGGVCPGRSLCPRVGLCPGPSPCEQNDCHDRQVYKHYLLATSFAGGNEQFLDTKKWCITVL